MKLNPGSRTRIFVDATVTVDPTTSTVELWIDNGWVSATWQSAAVHHDEMGDLPERWTRRARTTGYFAGPDMGNPSGATVLADGRHETKVRVTVGGDTIVGEASVIDVED